MADQTYTASKSRTNRPGWSISFRHPLRNDARGKPGLKIRRGLSTENETEADQLVAEMNIILSDRSWWNSTKRPEAERHFSKVIVNAFYDAIQAGLDKSEALREAHIPLPQKEDGYSRVLFVGTTGAGKTSLLRQLIGSDPDKDRFPSTAPAKTTIADIEVIQAEGSFEAVVTFFTEFQVQANIEDCIIDACLAAYKDAPKDKIAECFLNHRDQKFRLSYTLGGWQKATATDIDENEFSFDATPEPSLDEKAGLTDVERVENRKVLEGFIDQIILLTQRAKERLSKDLDTDADNPTAPDHETVEQLIEENLDNYIYDDEHFHALVHDVLDALRSRFARVNVGDGPRHRSGDWPMSWPFKTDDRDEFIRSIRWFSSNFSPEFGRLLTPLVGGIRVKGPLFPDFAADTPKLVLIDGQGLGHSADSSSSVTTHITERFHQVDVILLVDNAQQPMQAAPLSVLRAVAARGYNSKTAIAFTHFDQIKGQNLPTFRDKRNHVMDSVRNALSSLRDILGGPVARSMEHDIDDRCFMLGGVDQKLSQLPQRANEFMQEEMKKLIQFCKKAILPPPLPKACPVYNTDGISLAVREAIDNFRSPWLARLGFGSYEGTKKEHWTRVKALSRRIAGELDIEYDTLRPVADLVARLTESISRFLDQPSKWLRNPENEKEAQTAIAGIRRVVSEAIYNLAVRRLLNEHLEDWRTAYNHRDRDSTSLRARDLRNIYDEAAPLPDAVMPPPSRKFLSEVRKIVIQAIKYSGGQVQSGDFE